MRRLVEATRTPLPGEPITLLAGVAAGLAIGWWAGLIVLAGGSLVGVDVERRRDGRR